MATAAERFTRLRQSHNEYDSEAYNFLYEAMDYTLKCIAKKEREGGHVTTNELLEGFRAYAIEQFGCLAKTVFDEWNVKTTRDIGNIVYYLIKYGLMGKTENDRVEDFDNVYDFSVFDVKPVFDYDYERREWKVSYKQKLNF